MLRNALILRDLVNPQIEEIVNQLGGRKRPRRRGVVTNTSRLNNLELERLLLLFSSGWATPWMDSLFSKRYFSMTNVLLYKGILRPNFRGYESWSDIFEVTRYGSEIIDSAISWEGARRAVQRVMIGPLSSNIFSDMNAMFPHFIGEVTSGNIDLDVHPKSGVLFKKPSETKPKQLDF